MSLLCFCALTVVVPLLSMKGQRALRIHQKYLNLYSGDEWMNDAFVKHFIVFCCTPKALYNHVGGLSSTTTSVQHPLGWCDGCHRTTVPVRSPHTSYRWRGERVVEPIKCMRSPHTSYRWREESHRANQVYTLTTNQLQVERRES